MLLIDLSKSSFRKKIESAYIFLHSSLSLSRSILYLHFYHHHDVNSKQVVFETRVVSVSFDASSSSSPRSTSIWRADGANCARTIGGICFSIITSAWSRHHSNVIRNSSEITRFARIGFTFFLHSAASLPVDRDNLNWQSALLTYRFLFRLLYFFFNELRNAKLHFQCVETFFVLIGIVGVEYQVVGVIFCSSSAVLTWDSMHKNASSLVGSLRRCLPLVIRFFSLLLLLVPSVFFVCVFLLLWLFACFIRWFDSCIYQIVKKRWFLEWLKVGIFKRNVVIMWFIFRSPYN